MVRYGSQILQSLGFRAVTGLTRRMLRVLHDQFWDWRLGIRTMRSVAPIGGGAKAGDPTGYDVLWHVAQSLKPSDVVYDIGCGRGRACAVFARSGATAIGIEIGAEAAAAARANGVTVIEGDARTIDYPGATVLWLYNPFGAEALRAVLRRAQAPRVLFHNANAEHQAVLFAEGYAVTARFVRSGLLASGDDDYPVLHCARAATPWTAVAA